MKYVLLLVFLIGITNIQAQEKLTKNVKVPNIATKDVLGNNVNLQKLLKNNDRVLVCFFRPVWCPICNKRTHDLIARYDELKKQGIEVIAIYPSDREVMAQYVKDSKIPFLVISDPEEKLYKRYAIERSIQKVRASLENEDAKKQMKEGVMLFKGKNYKTSKDERYKTIINADFVVTTNRVLEIAYYGEYIGDHYDLDNLWQGATQRY